MIVAKSVVPRLGTSALRPVCCSGVLLRGYYGGYKRTMATVNPDPTTTTTNHTTTPTKAPAPPHVQESRPASIPSSQQPIEKRVKTEGIDHTAVVREYTWEGPSYTADDAESVQIAHRTPSSLSDYVALGFVTMLRWSFDKATGYKHSQKVAKGEISAQSKEAMDNLIMTPDMWMRRIIFLESVAGVPGFVAGIVRHLSSLRKLEREGGWIGTLLQESENERMHLMTFLQMDKPRPLMRLMIFGAQGVFFNAFFFSYLISPRTCHRFVGFLEEEAVMTYTRCLADIDAGNLDEWNNTAKIPEIAKEYWHLPKDAKLRDLILAVRADESTHRHVNHTFANLERRDRNPFAVADQGKHNPGRGVGMEREDCNL